MYFSSFQQVDEEEYGGTWELTKEGFMTSFALFLVDTRGPFPFKPDVLCLKIDASVCLWAGGLDHLLHGATLRLTPAGQTETDICWDLDGDTFPRRLHMLRRRKGCIMGTRHINTLLEPRAH